MRPWPDRVRRLRSCCTRAATRAWLASAALACALGCAQAASPAPGAAAGPAPATPPPVADDPDDRLVPQPFGYAVGDEFERRVRLTGLATPPAARSLPRPGRVDRWLWLREATLVDGELRLRYQLIDAPPLVQSIALPAIVLRAAAPEGTEGTVLREIRARLITAGPVTPPSVAVGMPRLQPDHLPSVVPDGARALRVALYAALLAALLVAWAWPWLVARLWPRRAGPFALALRTLRPLARHDAAASRRTALQALHAALDEAAGCTVAVDNLDTLLARRPRLAPLRNELAALLARSREVFYADAPAPAVAELLALGRRLHAHDSGRGR